MPQSEEKKNNQTRQAMRVERYTGAPSHRPLFQ